MYESFFFLDFKGLGVKQCELAVNIKGVLIMGKVLIREKSAFFEKWRKKNGHS